MRTKVAILLPTMGKMEAVLHDWLIGTAGKYSLLDLKSYEIAPVDKAFNMLHRRFLASDCEYAFVINDDECPEADCLERLIAADKDIVSGVCWKWDENVGPLPVAARWNEALGSFVWVQGVGLERIDRVSFSGVLIKRKVFEALPVGTYSHKATAACTCGWVDHLGSYSRGQCPKCGAPVVVDGTEMVSPGFLWMDAARDAGFEVWMDFSVRIHHFKAVDLLRVNDLMALARNQERSEALAAVKRLKDEGVSDEEIVAALVG